MVPVADAFLMHDREIYRQVDDSIVHFIDDQPMLLRRARGYVPTPILTQKRMQSGYFRGGRRFEKYLRLCQRQPAYLQRTHRRFGGREVYHHYIDSVEHLRQLFEVEPKIVVCDLHPGYFSTQYTLAKPDVKVIQVQHHWAHIASVLVEHNLTGPVIGIACDGTGYGTDGTIWGCECLIASLEKFERFGHLSYYPLAGADKASKEPIRPILGLLKKTYGEDFNLAEFGWLLEKIEQNTDKQRIILEQIEKKINTVETSSLGRIFDAVAALLGLGNFNHFEAQLPMALEAIIEPGVKDSYDFELVDTTGKPVQLDLSKMIKQLITDIQQKIPAGIISAKFHNCIAHALTEMAKSAREKTGLNTVALSGGVFCNRYLTGTLIKLLNENSFRVLLNRDVPANDGGISLGQAAIAAHIKNI